MLEGVGPFAAAQLVARFAPPRLAPGQVFQTRLGISAEWRPDRLRQRSGLFGQMRLHHLAQDGMGQGCRRTRIVGAPVR